MCGPTRGFWLLVGLGACAGHAATEGTVDSGSPTESCPPTAFDGRPVIDHVTSTCDEVRRTVTFDVELQGWSDALELYEIDTESADHWSDEVRLEWYRVDDCLGKMCQDAEIATGVDPTRYRKQVNTPFRCDVEYADGLVTFAVHAPGPHGYGDCLAWGSDAPDVVNGSVQGTHPPTFDLSRCRVVSSPR